MYVPKNSPEDRLEDIREWAEDEFLELSKNLVLSDFLRVKKLTEPPMKFLEGMIVFADGANWDPGSGEGIYCYYNSQWNKLG